MLWLGKSLHLENNQRQECLIEGGYKAHDEWFDRLVGLLEFGYGCHVVCDPLWLESRHRTEKRCNSKCFGTCILFILWNKSKYTLLLSEYSKLHGSCLTAERGLWNGRAPKSKSYTYRQIGRCPYLHSKWHIFLGIQSETRLVESTKSVTGASYTSRRSSRSSAEMRELRFETWWPIGRSRPSWSW